MECETDMPVAAAPCARRRFVKAAAFAAVFSLLASVAPLGAQQPGAFRPSDETPEQWPAGAGRDETFYACTACHNFKLVAQQGMTRGRWDETLDWMTQKHNMPPLEGNDREVVLDYLASAFPPRAPAARGGWQNPFMKQ